MAELTLEEKALIDKEPLSGDIRALFTKPTTGESTSDGNDDSVYRVNLSNLVLKLASQSVARQLHFTDRFLYDELLSIHRRLDALDFNLSSFTHLTTLIANKASDVDIWQAILDLITTLGPQTPSSQSRTPLKSIPPSFSGTPRTFSSSAYQDSEQTRKELEEPIRKELSGETYINVEGFFKKYFEDKPWSAELNRICDEATKDTTLYKFRPLVQPEESDVWAWLDGFQKKYLTKAQGVYYHTKSSRDISNVQGRRQLDVFLKNRDVFLSEKHQPTDYRVIGELTKSGTNVWKAKFLQLATYVRDIFVAQPTRWFTHGFLMFGTKIQLWVFDRSGAYAAETFDVSEHLNRFIKVIAGYAMMSDSELGLSPHIKHNESRKSITVTDAIGHKDLDLWLEPKPISSQNAVVCRGTTCFRTENGSTVVKLSWRAAKTRSEIDLLRIAQGIKGFPRLVGHKDVTTIKQLRSGLCIETKKDLGPESHSGTKRKWTDSTDESSTKENRSRSNTRRPPEQDTIQPESPSQCNPYRNRILTYLAITPAGRPLRHFKSDLEVLKAFRDAITMHRSLFVDRNILHRDISINNIILTAPNQNEGCTGMLIDLDMAVPVGLDGKNETSQEKKMTGTLEYIAIEIIGNAMREETAGIQHTYRHDLESFLYVFLSLCIRYGWPPDTKPTVNPLKKWYDGHYGEIRDSKLAKMTQHGFKDGILTEFSPFFSRLKPLAKELRDVLFSTGELYLGTPEDPSTLYGPMIKAFESTIREIESSSL